MFTEVLVTAQLTTQQGRRQRRVRKIQKFSGYVDRTPPPEMNPQYLFLRRSPSLDSYALGVKRSAIQSVLIVPSDDLPITLKQK